MPRRQAQWWLAGDSRAGLRAVEDRDDPVLYAVTESYRVLTTSHFC